ncbi:MAG: transposase [Holosporales bacterium]
MFLDCGSLKTHHSLQVRVWVNESQDQIDLFFLPAYSSDLNPDDLLN